MIEGIFGLGNISWDIDTIKGIFRGLYCYEFVVGAVCLVGAYISIWILRRFF